MIYDKKNKKNMKRIFVLGLCSMFLFTGVNTFAQSKETKKEQREERKEKRVEERKLEQIKLAQQNVANIESLNFSFYPSTVEPEFGIINQLSGMGNFYFTVDKTVLYLNLPYVGRFFINPVSPESSSININSNSFLYTVNSIDGVNVKVTIVPKDILNVMNEGIQFVLYMNKNSGYARLVMTADNRQEITYTGSFN